MKESEKGKKRGKDERNENICVIVSFPADLLRTTTTTPARQPHLWVKKTIETIFNLR
jgi:hypothetical protein